MDLATVPLYAMSQDGTSLRRCSLVRAPIMELSFTFFEQTVCNITLIVSRKLRSHFIGRRGESFCYFHAILLLLLCSFYVFIVYYCFISNSLILFLCVLCCCGLVRVAGGDRRAKSTSNDAIIDRNLIERKIKSQSSISTGFYLRNCTTWEIN